MPEPITAAFLFYLYPPLIFCNFCILMLLLNGSDDRPRGAAVMPWLGAHGVFFLLLQTLKVVPGLVVSAPQGNDFSKMYV